MTVKRNKFNSRIICAGLALVLAALPVVLTACQEALELEGDGEGVSAIPITYSGPAIPTNPTITFNWAYPYSFFMVNEPACDLNISWRVYNPINPNYDKTTLFRAVLKGGRPPYDYLQWSFNPPGQPLLGTKIEDNPTNLTSANKNWLSLGAGWDVPKPPPYNVLVFNGTIKARNTYTNLYAWNCDSDGNLPPEDEMASIVVNIRVTN